MESDDLAAMIATVVTGLLPFGAVFGLAVFVALVMSRAYVGFGRHFGVALGFGTLGAALGLISGAVPETALSLALPALATTIVGYLASTLKVRTESRTDEGATLGKTIIGPSTQTRIVEMPLIAMSLTRPAPAPDAGAAPQTTPPVSLDAPMVVVATVMMAWGLVGGYAWAAAGTEARVLAAEARAEAADIRAAGRKEEEAVASARRTEEAAVATAQRTEEAAAATLQRDLMRLWVEKVVIPGQTAPATPLAPPAP
jgi:hypothetical protein